MDRALDFLDKYVTAPGKFSDNLEVKFVDTRMAGGPGVCPWYTLPWFFTGDGRHVPLIFVHHGPVSDRILDTVLTLIEQRVSSHGRLRESSVTQLNNCLYRLKMCLKRILIKNGQDADGNYAFPLALFDQAVQEAEERMQMSAEELATKKEAEAEEERRKKREEKERDREALRKQIEAEVQAKREKDERQAAHAAAVAERRAMVEAAVGAAAAAAAKAGEAERAAASAATAADGEASAARRFATAAEAATSADAAAQPTAQAQSAANEARAAAARAAEAAKTAREAAEVVQNRASAVAPLLADGALCGGAQTRTSAAATADLKPHYSAKEHTEESIRASAIGGRRVIRAWWGYPKDRTLGADVTKQVSEALGAGKDVLPRNCSLFGPDPAPGHTKTLEIEVEMRAAASGGLGEEAAAAATTANEAAASASAAAASANAASKSQEAAAAAAAAALKALRALAQTESGERAEMAKKAVESAQEAAVSALERRLGHGDDASAGAAREAIEAAAEVLLEHARSEAESARRKEIDDAHRDEVALLREAQAKVDERRAAAGGLGAGDGVGSGGVGAGAWVPTDATAQRVTTKLEGQIIDGAGEGVCSQCDDPPQGGWLRGGIATCTNGCCDDVSKVPTRIPGSVAANDEPSKLEEEPCRTVSASPLQKTDVHGLVLWASDPLAIDRAKANALHSAFLEAVDTVIAAWPPVQRVLRTRFIAAYDSANAGWLGLTNSPRPDGSHRAEDVMKINLFAFEQLFASELQDGICADTPAHVDRRTVVVLRMMKTVLHELAHWMPGETHSHDLHWRTNQDDLVHIVLLYFKGRPAVAVQRANIFDRVRSYIGK